MERDNGKTVLEKSLFHGTHQNVVEAICRTNFDWRLCGVHGTMYGQGKNKIRSDTAADGCAYLVILLQMLFERVTAFCLL